MKKLMIVLFIILLHCSEKESKNNGTPDPAYDDPRSKNFMLSGYEMKYNDFIYYNMPHPEIDLPVQIRN